MNGAASSIPTPESHSPPVTDFFSALSPRTPPTSVPRMPETAVDRAEDDCRPGSEAHRARVSRKVGMKIASPPMEKVISVSPATLTQ